MWSPMPWLDMPKVILNIESVIIEDWTELHYWFICTSQTHVIQKIKAALSEGLVFVKHFLKKENAIVILKEEIKKMSLLF